MDRTRKVGRKPVLTEADKDRLVKLTDQMVKTANVRYAVTYDMIRARYVPHVGLRTIQNALHERNVRFHKLREKPILTDDDVKARYAWAKKYRSKAKSWWKKHIHLHIDNHAFKVPAHGVARNMLAAKRVHGTFRTPGKSLERQHVKASRKMRLNTGARSILIAGGIGNGKALLWHAVEEQWCAHEAEKMYRKPLQKCLKKEHPGKRKWNLLEDNDPAGYQSKLAQTAKEEHGIKTFVIPKRSPDLNVMDYYFWNEVTNKTARAQLFVHAATTPCSMTVASRARFVCN